MMMMLMLTMMGLTMMMTSTSSLYSKITSKRCRLALEALDILQALFTRCDQSSLRPSHRALVSSLSCHHTLRVVDLGCILDLLIVKVRSLPSVVDADPTNGSPYAIFPEYEKRLW
jgi:hypothetical protein